MFRRFLLLLASCGLLGGVFVVSASPASAAPSRCNHVVKATQSKNLPKRVHHVNVHGSTICSQPTSVDNSSVWVERWNSKTHKWARYGKMHGVGAYHPSLRWACAQTSDLAGYAVVPPGWYRGGYKWTYANDPKHPHVYYTGALLVKK